MDIVLAYMSKIKYIAMIREYLWYLICVLTVINN